jgi:hypothetical protein
MDKAKSILLLALALAGCSTATLVRDDGLVKIYERPSAIPHGYDDTSIEIKGARWHHIWTGNAYYVRVPGRNAILFVTSTGGSGTKTTRIHIVDLDNGHHVESQSSEDIWFGLGLGYPKENDVSDYVESVQQRFLILVSKSPQQVCRYKMNLENGALEKL